MLVLEWFVVSSLGALCAAHGDGDAPGSGAQVNGTLSGPHVCTRDEKYNVTEKKVKIRYETIDGTTGVPVTVTWDAVVTKTRTVQECCGGYEQTIDSKCIPKCNESCVKGKCVAPNVCECEPNYGGPSCNHSCPVGTWGSGCTGNCICKNNATCNPFNGECSCTTGWIDVNCDRACPPGKYGDGCVETCQCKNEADCHHISGQCDCKPGFKGSLCEQKCPEGTHGKDCKSECRCQNGGTCDPTDGSCSCTPGWMGQVCGNQCSSGTWGPKCKNACHCFNSATCHHLTGVCECQPGYHGEWCGEECANNTYGSNCSGVCSCENGGKCSFRTGHCDCRPGYKGDHCGQKCDPGFYGEGCKHCSCKNGATCDHVTGACHCIPGLDCQLDDMNHILEAHGFVIGGTTITALLLCVIFILLVRYRVVLSKLKWLQYVLSGPPTENLHTVHNVAYTSNPKGTEDGVGVHADGFFDPLPVEGSDIPSVIPWIPTTAAPITQHNSRLGRLEAHMVTTGHHFQRNQRHRQGV